MTSPAAGHRQRSRSIAASGTLEESTAGGVASGMDTRRPRAPRSAWRIAPGMPMIVGTVDIANAATTENARVENMCEVAIVTAD